MHLDCGTSCREVCITCDAVVEFVDVLATILGVFFCPTLETHFAIKLYTVCVLVYIYILGNKNPPLAPTAVGPDSCR